MDALASQSMIVSHSNKFIFLKTRKTAGSSIELALAQHCAPGDIITPLDEELGGDQNFRTDLGALPPHVPSLPWFAHLSPKRARRALRERERLPMFARHSPASYVKYCVGEEVWHEYYKFAVERNPWDRVISAFHWRNYCRRCEGNREFRDISAYIDSMRKRRPWRLSNWDIYGINGEIAVDRVLQFGRLYEEIDQIKDAGILPPGVELKDKRLKSETRPKDVARRTVLKREDVEKIRHHCRREISAFGYSVPREVSIEGSEAE